MLFHAPSCAACIFAFSILPSYSSVISGDYPAESIILPKANENAGEAAPVNAAITTAV